MSTTTVDQEIKRLRAFLNPYIRGAGVDSILTALATGSSSYLINTLRQTNDQLYIATASGEYLDERLAEHGITRPPAVGLSDDVFRQIGLEIKNRKQVRDLINNLLDAIFGDEFVRASSPSKAFEPYNLQDGDTIIINFDDHITVPITFHTAEFSSIAAATAQEVADAITKTLRSLGYSGTAIAKNDGNGNYVEILSDTIGPASSVTVLGGRAQNVLLFDSVVPAGGNMSTQWTLSVQPGGFIRFTWSGGANPNIGKLTIGNYVNVFGGGFASSSNEGSHTITTAVGGTVNNSYFEVLNPLGTSGIIVQGSDNAVLFYNPTRRTLQSRTSYAALYQSSARLLQIFLPATTKVIRRGRIGSAHIHYPPFVSFVLNAQPNPGDVFSITPGILIQAGANFTIGATIAQTIANMAAALNLSAGIVAYANSNVSVTNNEAIDVLNVYIDDPTFVMTGTYSGSANIVPSGPQGDMLSLLPNQQGPYGYDITQPFQITNVGTLLNQNLDATMSRVIQVKDSSLFPDAQGYIVLGYGTQEQEGPIPIIARPSSTTLLVSPAYTIKKTHPIGTDVALAYNHAVDISADGFDYPLYITDTVSGRIYAQDLINSVTASGINIVFTILYPSDVGLGKAGTIYSEISTIYGV